VYETEVCETENIEANGCLEMCAVLAEARALSWRTGVGRAGFRRAGIPSGAGSFFQPMAHVHVTDEL
jgi:hypothetical protein